MGSDFAPRAMPGLGDLDSAAWSEIPIGMDAFAASGLGLIRWRGSWRIVIGSPAWGFFYGRATVPGWDAPGREWNTPDPGGDRWDQSDSEMQRPGQVPLIPLDVGMDPIFDMANATNTTFSVTPGTASLDASNGSLSTSGASVQLAASGAGDTRATVTQSTRGWMDWVPWMLLAGAVGLALKGR